MLLSEQWVLVTGGARGLGAAITRALVREGAGVVVNYRKSETLAHALRDEFGDRVLPIQADVTDAAAVARLFETAQAQTGQPIVSVVNNALADFQFDGDARPKIDSIDWARFQQQLDGSLKGALNAMQAAAAGMRSRGFDLIASSTPVRRVTTPEEFADAVLFFLSPWARAVTGQNLIVDGGLVKG
ncbi:SDR family oxidoreductase [Paraburkholderia nemoris]|uniref:Uncharacterized protein n=1 Tax=Paraburkholderia nemoris TaxID=2793076 RepID=A0ABM8R493_9BURK|nr:MULTISPECIES: SDR family oxidoreductase [Paraburkholderia]KPD14547.1 3-ketoacyl-ACP reductase [Burkholderia sp. ST111]MBK3810462.1 SDR family oxidoreductase [Paraburkholderia aspalathi]CAE6696986.1 hypothetical protein R75777_00520 [Paraburkholderia nemoris]CAE6732119.1 hypothetical protein R69776_02033 [Paraburkholderia nemoris]